MSLNSRPHVISLYLIYLSIIKSVNLIEMNLLKLQGQGRGFPVLKASLTVVQ